MAKQLNNYEIENIATNYEYRYRVYELHKRTPHV